MSPRNAERRPGQDGVNGNAGNTNGHSVEPPDALFAVSRGEHSVGFVENPALARDAGIAVVEAASDDTDRAVIDQAITVLCERGGPFSINDVRPLLPAVRPSLVGARFLAASKRRDIHRVGYVPASHTAGHCRPVTLWAAGPSRGGDGRA